MSHRELTKDNYAAVAEEIKKKAIKPKGEPIPIVSWIDRGSVKWLHDNVVKIFQKVADQLVVICSLVGACRTGKSFALNLLIRESDRLYKGSSVCYDDQAVVGFEWAQGEARTTVGLVIWSEPYNIQLENGEEAAVLFMDTHGIFDQETPPEKVTNLVTLTKIISSIQLVATAAVSVTEKDGMPTPLQRLIFLVRDWIDPAKHEYGAEGGADYWKSKMDVTDETYSATRQTIQKAFEKIDCFLLPQPGPKAATTPSARTLKKMKEPFTGKMEDITEEFKECLPELSHFILKTNLERCVKRIGGVKTRGRDLMKYIRARLSLCENERSPSVQDAISVFLYEANERLYNECLDSYAEDAYRMQLTEKTSLDAFQEKLSDIFEGTMKKFDLEKKKGNHDVTRKVRSRLEEKLRREEQKVWITVKAAFDIQTAKGRVACLEAQTMHTAEMTKNCNFSKLMGRNVDEYHEEAAQKAMLHFREKVKELDSYVVEMEEKVLQEYFALQKETFTKASALKQEESPFSPEDTLDLAYGKRVSETSLSFSEKLMILSLNCWKYLANAGRFLSSAAEVILIAGISFTALELAMGIGFGLLVAGTVSMVGSDLLNYISNLRQGTVALDQRAIQAPVSETKTLPPQESKSEEKKKSE